MERLANGEWLTRERVIVVASLFALASLASLIWLFAGGHGTLDSLGRPMGTDFSNVWSAGWMADHGQAAQAWDWNAHFAVQRAVHHKTDVDLFGWHYPPPFLLIAGLLAKLPYVPALMVWQLATFVPFAWLMWRLVPRWESLLLTLAAPVTLICLTHGHNGFLTALLLAGGLALLERRPVFGGLLLGALIYKPQFALILPVLVLATRNWRAILGAIISATVLVALTLVLWGWPVWQAFLDSLPLTRQIVIEQGATGWFKIASPFAAARMWGAGLPLAYTVQLAVTLAAMAAVAWAALSLPPERRNALACAAVLASTPYVLDYDLVVLLPALAWISIDRQREGWLVWDKTLIALIWAAPLAGRQIAEFTYLPLDLMSIFAVTWLALRAPFRASPSRR
ncbi:MAG: glycosyltransferase family 87 protein [Sphingomicrobium sp.]